MDLLIFLLGVFVGAIALLVMSLLVVSKRADELIEKQQEAQKQWEEWEEEMKDE